MIRVLFAVTLVCLTPFVMCAPVHAETQASKYNRLRKTVQSLSMDSKLVNPFLAGVVNVYSYDTAVELLAATPTEGIIGYAIDTNAFYFYAGSSWIILPGVSGADLSISGGAGAITFTDTASSIIVPDNDTTALLIGSTGQLDLLTIDSGDDTETVIVTGTTATTAFHVDVGESLFDEGVNMAVPAMALGEIRFCGNGPNATTATYIGPVVEADHATDMTFTAAGCDAKDNTTEATADAPWHAALAFKPVAMVCTSTCGTNDVMTLQLRDDTANVAGMTCDITLTGAAAQCVVRDASPATVAANSAIAVRVVNSTDDNCSAGDVECRVFVTY